ncbi:uncharacterized protein OCT59_009227 [Rhizophagus irregularis]|nr:hypothetical protein OCT59_009227 [Rhizophagus irregularis]GET59361.1 hypothetical protein GLOIN_2v1783073 [Rhizophagus irregularis DAOM 181602=DAOM 197198]CAB4475227.1 unnamed protein product [Rhizophagus irregularis]
MNKEDFRECGFETGPAMRLADAASWSTIFIFHSQLLCVESSVANIKPDREELHEELHEELLRELRKGLREEFRNLCGILCKNLRND